MTPISLRQATKGRRPPKTALRVDAARQAGVLGTARRHGGTRPETNWRVSHASCARQPVLYTVGRQPEVE